MSCHDVLLGRLSTYRPVGVEHCRGGVEMEGLAVMEHRLGQVPGEEGMVALILQLLCLLHSLCTHLPAV